MTVSYAPAPTTTVCRDTSCLEATTHVDECECRCGGEFHGRIHAATRALATEAFSARSVGGFTPSMLAAMDDDEAWV